MPRRSAGRYFGLVLGVGLLVAGAWYAAPFIVAGGAGLLLLELPLLKEWRGEIGALWFLLLGGIALTEAATSSGPAAWRAAGAAGGVLLAWLGILFTIGIFRARRSR